MPNGQRKQVSIRACIAQRLSIVHGKLCQSDATATAVAVGQKQRLCSDTRMFTGCGILPASSTAVKKLENLAKWETEMEPNQAKPHEKNPRVNHAELELL